jgi:hypothetical protein
LKTIILTVQSNGSGGWRLGINSEDSKNIFICRRVKVRLCISNVPFIECFTACGNPCDDNGNWISLNPETGKPYKKKGYDLNKKELSDWLSENYPNDNKGGPRKLKFTCVKEKHLFILNFVSEVN